MRLIKEMQMANVNGKNVFLETAYLYSIRNGEFKIYTGEVRDNRYKAIFINVEKSFTCSKNPGEIYNGVVWFSDRSDEEAIKLLIKYEDDKIVELSNTINNHKSKVKILEEVLNYI